MQRRMKKRLVLGLVAALLVAVAVWIAWGDKALELNTYTVTSDRLPDAFDGFRIAQVSDLHNVEMGKDNERLLALLEEAKPDAIVITGDMIASPRNTRVDVALRFAERALVIAPCYYVTGNHEEKTAKYADLKAGLLALGVVVLEDARATIEREGEVITVLGAHDPSFNADPTLPDDEAVMDAKLKVLVREDDGYTLLLSHRPELFEVYAAYGVDLVFSGHAHGGQFRLPLVGGVVAPNQGLFPKYDAGLFSEGETHMVISRGIGNSILPFRVNNRPEVVLVELRSATR